MLGQLNGIDNILNCSVQNDNGSTVYVSYCRFIGLFNGNRNVKDKNARISFIDEANIGQFFDGYKNNKELWEYIRTHPVDTRTFYAIIRKEYPNFVKDRMGQLDLSSF